MVKFIFKGDTMTEDFHLVAVVSNGKRSVLFRIPLHESLQGDLKESWNAEYEFFVHKYQEIDYRAGQRLKSNQCFRFVDFDFPLWIANYNTQSAADIPAIEQKYETYRSIQGTIAYTRNQQDEEMMLFQDFSVSKAIGPGQFLQFESDRYKTTEQPGVLLGRELSAVYSPQNRKLKFRGFRAVNSFLPISDFYKKVSELEIRKLLQHDRLATEDSESWAKGANQWFRTRFTLLRDSGILDRFSANEIKARSIGYDVSIQIVNGRIVFPTDRISARKLLKFLNEEVFKGPITDTIYETNYNRKQPIY